MRRPTRRPPSEQPLFAQLGSADQERLRAAGWVLKPIGAYPWWESPDGQGIYTEAEALRQLDASARKERDR